MLSVVFGLPLVFSFVVWRSYRSAAARAARGEPITTPGAVRWTSSDGTAEPRRDSP